MKPDTSDHGMRGAAVALLVAIAALYFVLRIAWGLLTRAAQ
jgi:hypothetical protein